MSEKNFVDGMYIDKPNEHTPNWILAKIGIHVEQLKEWLDKQEKNGDYLAKRIEIKLSIDKKTIYAQLSDFVPRREDTHEPPPEDQYVPF